MDRKMRHSQRLKSEISKDMKKVFQNIIDICEQYTDTEGTLSEIRLKAKNRVMRYEWKEKYGIELSSDCKFAEYDYCNIGNYQIISYFKDGYISHKEGGGRSISWPENNKQPVNEWLYEVSFSTGAYIFGDDYEGQKQLFHDFFEELRTYKPDYEDLHNHNLYWKLENANKILTRFKKILIKYSDKNTKELKEREINKLKAELEALVKV
jgi:hypothetical protein